MKEKVNDTEITHHVLISFKTADEFSKAIRYIKIVRQSRLVYSNNSCLHMECYIAETRIEIFEKGFNATIAYL